MVMGCGQHIHLHGPFLDDGGGEGSTNICMDPMLLGMRTVSGDWCVEVS